jgi:hypothetical protein
MARSCSGRFQTRRPAWVTPTPSRPSGWKIPRSGSAACRCAINVPGQIDESKQNTPACRMRVATPTARCPHNFSMTSVCPARALVLALVMPLPHSMSGNCSRWQGTHVHNLLYRRMGEVMGKSVRSLGITGSVNLLMF